MFYNISLSFSLDAIFQQCVYICVVLLIFQAFSMMKNKILFLGFVFSTFLILMILKRTTVSTEFRYQTKNTILKIVSKQPKLLRNTDDNIYTERPDIIRYYLNLSSYQKYCYVSQFACISLYMQYRDRISSRFSINSESFDSELIENLKEMFPRYW